LKPSKNRVVLGLNAYSHDAGVALIVDGELVFAAEEERYDRRKHSHAFPAGALRAALGYAGLEPGDVDAVAFCWRKDMARWTKALYVFRHLPRSLAFLARLLDNAGQDSPPLPSDLHACAPVHLLGCRVWAIRLSVTGEDGHVLLPERGEAERLRDAMLELGESFGIREVPLAAREVLRVEAGIPWFGVDMNTDTRVSDTPLEQYAVSYTKGCYLGQEVVAKLKAHGSPRYAMVGLVFEQDKNELPEAESDLIEDGERVGRIASSAFSPALDRPIALAYLDRQHRTPGQELRLGEPGDRAPLSARVQVLPFWEAPSRADRARTLYDKALERFQKDLDDRDHSPLELLEEAVLLDPGFEDAYETLGVILNRQGRVDEAIETMQRLVRLNPDCVMAHTNLSVFYVSKGMVREAEQEKAHAAMLQFKQTQDAKKAKEAAAAERTRIEQQAQDRIRMFKEVLELDPGDVLATYGLGIAHFQLEEYERAVPHLEKATGLKKDYSAAFLNLGKCHEFLKQTDRAREAYQAGIAAASRKGDLMPMREMERRLNALTAATKDSGQ